jgi:fatty-acyl-CoA synthase
MGDPTPTGDLWGPLGATRTSPDLIRIWNESEYSVWSWDEWRTRSLRFAAGLHALGVGSGDRVACLLTNTPASCCAALGTWLTGACLISLPSMARGMNPSQYAAQLRRIVAQSGPVVLLCDTGLVPLLDGNVSVRVVPFHEVPKLVSFEPAPPRLDDAAFVQYSSGSTTDPRGSVLTPRAIAWQLATLERKLAIDPEADTFVAWLPLSHDMGFFGCLLLSYWTGHRLVLSTPQRFLRRPASWLADCARYSATLSATPSFGLALASRVARASLSPAFPMRRMVVGSDHIDPNTLREASVVLGKERLPWSSLVPAYGLAEAVLAVTMADPGAGPTVLELDRDALSGGRVETIGVAEARESGIQTVVLTSAGRALPGNRLQVAHGERVGEIVVESPSLAAGYLDAPRQTKQRFTSCGLLTGDLGFVNENELYLCGRLDDLMSIAGRNVFARDIETALAVLPGVRAGACAVVNVDSEDGTRLIAVVEPRPDHPAFQIMADSIAAAALSVVGVRVDECLFVRRGRLPKTPSGKVQRFRCRELATEAKTALDVRVRPVARSGRWADPGPS